MGLFSKFGKKERDAAEDSGYYRAADDRALTERARSKRASANEAGASRTRGRKEGADPVLPEKKRARRRLVGAIALALAVAIGLPMMLDSEPKPLANDIAIQIPSRDKPAEPDAPASAAIDDKTAQAEALDQSEEIVEPDTPAPKMTAAPVAPTSPPKETLAKVPEQKVGEHKVAEHKPEPKLDAKPEHKPESKPEARLEAKSESKPEPRHEAKAPEPKKLADSKPEPKKESRPEPKDTRAEDAARALALLEGKPAAAAAPADSGRFVIQVAALAARDKVEELQDKLRDAGIKSFTQKSPTGELTRVKVGPFGSREEAEKARAKLQKIGLSGSLAPA
jgi:DedD protein